MEELTTLTLTKVPESLYKKIKDLAIKNGRSLSMQARFMLVAQANKELENEDKKE